MFAVRCLMPIIATSACTRKQVIINAKKATAGVPIVTAFVSTINARACFTIEVTRDIMKTIRNGIVVIRADQVIVRRISGVMNAPITGMVIKPAKMMAKQA